MYLRDPSHAWHLISPKYTTTYTSSTATAANTLLLVLSPLIALPPPTSGYRERETCVKISECFMSLVPWYLWTDFSQHRISALASTFFCWYTKTSLMLMAFSSFFTFSILQLLSLSFSYAFPSYFLKEVASFFASAFWCWVESSINWRIYKQ